MCKLYTNRLCTVMLTVLMFRSEKVDYLKTGQAKPCILHHCRPSKSEMNASYSMMKPLSAHRLHKRRGHLKKKKKERERKKREKFSATYNQFQKICQDFAAGERGLKICLQEGAQNIRF